MNLQEPLLGTELSSSFARAPQNDGSSRRFAIAKLGPVGDKSYQEVAEDVKEGIKIVINEDGALPQDEKHSEMNQRAMEDHVKNNEHDFPQVGAEQSIEDHV